MIMLLSGVRHASTWTRVMANFNVAFSNNYLLEETHHRANLVGVGRGGFR